MVQHEGRLSVDNEARSTASPERLFTLLADVARWPEWTFPDEATREQDGSPDVDGVGAVRRFRRGTTVTRERVVLFERPHAFSYELLEGIAVRNYRADVTIAVDPAGGSIVRWHSSFDPKFRGTGWLWKIGFRRFLGRTAQDLAKAAAEPGVS
ncbi:MAG: SRPBCC family protein [Acidimicrobiia bacterium]